MFTKPEFCWLLVGLLIFLSLVAASKKAESFVAAVETLLNKTFAGGERIIEAWLRICANWLKKASEQITDHQPDNAQASILQANDHPLLTLLGLICLGLGGVAAYGDYYILNQSLSIFWPISETAWVIAANLVALKALVGICLHLFRGPHGKPMRKVLYALLLALLVCEFSIAYLRVIEIETATKIEQMAALAEVEQGSLIINDAAVRGSDSPAVPNEPTSSTTADGASRKNYLSLYAILSGLITFLLALSETIGMRAAVHYAGVALVWLPASLLLSPLALAFCGLRFLSKSGIVSVITIMLAVSIDVLSKLGALAVSGVKFALACVKRVAEWLRCLPAKLANSYRTWQKARLRHQEEKKKLRERLKLEREAELKAFRNELMAEAGDAERRRTYLNSEAEACWQQHARMTGKWRGAVEEIFEGNLLPSLKGSARQIIEQLSAAFAQMVTEKTRTKVAPVVEQVASAVAEVYAKTGAVLSSVDGYRSPQPLPHRVESSAAAQNWEI